MKIDQVMRPQILAGVGIVVTALIVFLLTNGGSMAEVRVTSPTPVYSQAEASGTALAVIPTGAVIEVKNAMEAWLEICATLGGRSQCGFVLKNQTTWQP